MNSGGFDAQVNMGGFMATAIGTFEVKLTPAECAEPTLGRMILDKIFHGPLAATSKGEMLSCGGLVKGSAGYVALEQVTGILDGRAGSFALQHTGTMNRGVPSLTVRVVPDTGTGDLSGLAGSMTIDLAGGAHAYTFNYTLPPG